MKILHWNQLDGAKRDAALARAPQNCSDEVRAIVAGIISQVREAGDVSVRDLTNQLDGVDLETSRVLPGEMEDLVGGLDARVKSALDTAYSNIESFHLAGKPSNLSVETVGGVNCQARYIGIDRVGLYAPGGATPLPSSVLMMGVPAKIAGCREVVLCSSPNRNGNIDPAIAYAAKLCGIDLVFKIGGAQAIAAMAFGTEKVPACNKLYGPGSVWVTEAKRQIAASEVPVTIDMAAGPSEAMVIADDDANPVFVAADLLAQLEHGADSQAILVTDSVDFGQKVSGEIRRMTSTLSREELIRQSLAYSRIIVAHDLMQAVEIANRYAAEHLIIQTTGPDKLLQSITAAGSVFLGPWTPEVLGDYCSGTNHVLPTCGLASSVNGLSTVDFMKRITVQQATPAGLKNLAQTARTLSEWENLTAHSMAISVREQALAVESSR